MKDTKEIQGTGGVVSRRLVEKSPLPEAIEGVGHTVIGCAIEVHRVLGPDLLEGVYEDAMVYELMAAGLGVRRQATMPVLYKGHKLRDQVFDLIVNDVIVVELKSVERAAAIHRAQLLSYLRISRLPLGFLFNFNVVSLMEGFERVYNERAESVKTHSSRPSASASASSR